METCNIAIKPAGTRLHCHVILRFLYSFGQCSDVGTCVTKLLDSGVDVVVFNSTTIEVRLFLCRQGALCRRAAIVFLVIFCATHTQTRLVHNLTTIHISEWVELINMLHVETFMPMLAEMRERYQ